MAVLVTVLLPVNYHGGRANRAFDINGNNGTRFNVTGLDTLSWQNVAPNQTDRYWAHLVCALLVIGWTLWRIYREKMHFIKVRQDYLSSPEHRLRASARTILVTNIPSEYRSSEQLEGLFDVFVDNDDRSKLQVWVNRDYAPLREKVVKLRKLRHQLEKEELKFVRAVNKRHRKGDSVGPAVDTEELPPVTAKSEAATEATQDEKVDEKNIIAIFETDSQESEKRRQEDPKMPKQSTVKLVRDGSWWKPAPKFRSNSETRTVTKVVWLRAEIAHLTVQVEEMLRDLDNEDRFKRQNSAFIQFNRQMSANMAVGLTSHHRPGCMSPRFLDVAPHEIIWKNMGLTSLGRFIRMIIAVLFFVAMIILWGIPVREGIRKCVIRELTLALYIVGHFSRYSFAAQSTQTKHQLSALVAGLA